jgi:hypothetical protein
VGSYPTRHDPDGSLGRERKMLRLLHLSKKRARTLVGLLLWSLLPDAGKDGGGCLQMSVGERERTLEGLFVSVLLGIVGGTGNGVYLTNF